MLRGMYSATAGMIAQQRKHDAATNNIANVNTPGFKSANTVMRSFPEMLISVIRDGENGVKGTIGSLHGGVFAEESLPLFLQGDVTATGNPTDLALMSNIQVPGLEFDDAGRATTPQGDIVYQPQAFFTVAGPDGTEAYTRDGKFSVNDSGEWVTSSGYRLLDTNGQPIVLEGRPEDIQFTPNGSLFESATGEPVLDVNGNPVQLRISIIDNPYNLLRYGNSVFVLNEGADPARLLGADESVQVMQGYMERSNVDPTAATIDMMTAMRAYEANQKVIQFYDRSMDKAVNEVGRV